MRGDLNPKARLILQALDELGSGTSAQVYDKLRGQGIGQQYVRSVLAWLSRWKTPLVTLESRKPTGSGRAGIWKITNFGREVARGK